MNHALRVYDSVEAMLPNPENPSPLVRIRRLCPKPEFVLYAKLEWMNPFGSVKDRPAAAMLAALEASGALGGGRGLVEPTSGNTGLSLAALAAAKGLRMRAVVPNKVPTEKKVLLKAVGAELDVVSDELCPFPGAGSEGTINLAKSYARTYPERYVMPNQYENCANVEAHYRTTGPEIWRQTEGRVTHLFVSLGTCGTVTGTARFLKEKKPDIQVVAVQPSEGHDVPGLRNLSQLGVSKLFDPSLIDEILEIDYRLAYDRALDLCRMEGLLAGPSSGLILEGAREYLRRQPAAEGLAVLIFPDNLFKYVNHFLKHHPELGV